MVRPERRVLTVPPLDKLGPEAATITDAELAALFAANSMRVHGFLRDQRMVAGIGRRLANEVCHTAKMSPFANTRKLGAAGAATVVDGDSACIAEGLEYERTRADMSSSKDRPQRCTATPERRAPCAATRSAPWSTPVTPSTTARRARRAARCSPTTRPANSSSSGRPNTLAACRSICVPNPATTHPTSCVRRSAPGEYIAETFFDPGVRQVNAERGMLGFTGTFEGQPISVQSTGMGCPSAGIVFEELIMLGATRLVRVGTCGGLRRRHGDGRHGHRHRCVEPTTRRRCATPRWRGTRRAPRSPSSRPPPG